MKKILWILGLLILQSSSTLAAMPINEGSFIGKLKRGHGTELTRLMVKKVPGREESFYLLVTAGPIQQTREASLYLADPLIVGDQYALTPYTVTASGEIARANDNPSLVLKILPGSEPSKPAVSITNSNGGNTTGIQGFIRTKGCESKVAWKHGVVSGRYSLAVVERDAANVGIESSEPNDPSKIASVSFQVQNKLNGSYLMREKKDGFFVYEPQVVTATGVHLKEYPKYIGMFLEKLGVQYMMLINPVDSSDVIDLKRIK